jgi:hypothetical protein
MASTRSQVTEALALLQGTVLSVEAQMSLARVLLCAARDGVLKPLDPYLNDGQLTAEQQQLLETYNQLRLSIHHLDLAFGDPQELG